MAAGLLAVLAFGACWIGAIVYWHGREGDPGTRELMFYLFILPGALLGGALLTRKHLGDTSASAAARPVPAPEAAPLAPAPPVGQPLAIIAAAVRSPYGATAEALASALAGKEARPTLDPSLVDDAGYPVATARCADAVDDTVLTRLTAWLTEAAIDVAFDDAGSRALVMATHVATELAQHTIKLQDAPLLHLAPVLPSSWTREQRHAASLWLQHTVAHGGWPLERIELMAAVDTDIFDAVPALLLADLAARPFVAAMVIACASHLGEETIQQWRVGQPPDAVAGEGAAGLLLTDPAQAAAIDGALFALMSPIQGGRRDTDADTSRGPVPPLLAKLAQDALDAAQCERGAVAMIVADTSARPGRMLELMGYAGAAMPQLDDQADIIALGHASGSCGAAPAMTALALAHHHACARTGPVLWIANDHAYQRCVAVVQPPRAR
jgi:hypothetical protein